MYRQPGIVVVTTVRSETSPEDAGAEDPSAFPFPSARLSALYEMRRELEAAIRTQERRDWPTNAKNVSPLTKELYELAVCMDEVSRRAFWNVMQLIKVATLEASQNDPRRSRRRTSRTTTAATEAAHG
jgi:hypothetical protein